MATTTSSSLPSDQRDTGFLANILTPGSSLDPTFLLVLDGAFALLLCVFLGLLFLTRGSIHIVALIGIEGCLWASIKWCVIVNTSDDRAAVDVFTIFQGSSQSCRERRKPALETCRRRKTIEFIPPCLYRTRRCYLRPFSLVAYHCFIRFAPSCARENTACYVSSAPLSSRKGRDWQATQSCHH